MIRLKQKKEAAEKAADDAAAAAAAAVSSSSGTIAMSGSESRAPDLGVAETNTADDGEATTSSGGLKLLGIGGKGARSGTGGKPGGKKRTPGEIRIQKGTKQLFILAAPRSFPIDHII